MKKDILRELAEAHFKYTEEIIEKCVTEQLEYESMIGLCHYLYTESMIHGYKHCKDELLSVIIPLLERGEITNEAIIKRIEELF